MYPVYSNIEFRQFFRQRYSIGILAQQRTVEALLLLNFSPVKRVIKQETHLSRAGKKWSGNTSSADRLSRIFKNLPMVTTLSADFDSFTILLAYPLTTVIRIYERKTICSELYHYTIEAQWP